MRILTYVAAPVAAFLVISLPASALTYDVRLRLDVTPNHVTLASNGTTVNNPADGQAVTVVGAITTDGTLGTIGSTHLLSWSLTISDWLGNSRTISNVGGRFSGFLTASSTTLDFVSAQGQSSLFRQSFYAGPAGGGTDFASLGGGIPLLAQIVQSTSGPNQFTFAAYNGTSALFYARDAQGNAIYPTIGKIVPSPVPLPVSAALLAAVMAGIGILGYARRRAG